VDLCIDGRVALVSGASSGIGFAVTEALADAGCSVMMTARTLARLEDAAAPLEKAAPDRIDVVAGDMTEAADVERVVASTRSRFGPIGIVLSNVSGYTLGQPRPVEGAGGGAFATAPPAAYREEFRNLVVGAWLLAQAALPDMLAAQWGRIVNIGSRVAREPDTSLPHALPNTVRPAAAGMHRLLAARLAGTGVTVNSILTGDINTDRGQKYWAALAAKHGVTLEQALAEEFRRIPIGRLGEASELAALVAFLCSEQARSITGQSLPVDGGMSRHL
jgi:NAD(P)-dependent dehydrogenase (short-subunit alcohol dehydrogenase family)